MTTAEKQGEALLSNHAVLVTAALLRIGVNVKDSFGRPAARLGVRLRATPCLMVLQTAAATRRTFDTGGTPP